MMQALGTPTTADLRAITQMNLIKDCKVNTEDVNLAQRACGPDVDRLQ